MGLFALTFEVVLIDFDGAISSLLVSPFAVAFLHRVA
jgi:hypothetical protein